jgi:hypothetical protein
VSLPAIDAMKATGGPGDGPEIAEALFNALTSYAGGEPVFLDVPANNPDALAPAKRHGMVPVFETARMYLGTPQIPEPGKIYGITSFELG